MYSLCTHRIQLQQWLLVCNIFVNILHDITYCQRLHNSQLFSNLCPPPCWCIFSLLSVLDFNKWHLFLSDAVLVFFSMHNIKNYVQSSWPLITLEHIVEFVIWSKLDYLIRRRKLVYVDFNKQRGRLMSHIWKQSDFKSYSNTASHHTLNSTEFDTKNQFDVNERRGKFYELNIKITGKKIRSKPNSITTLHHKK